jgi:hypothetical protein
MLIYSKKIIQFVRTIKIAAKEILSQEMGLKVVGDRFYNYRQTSSYPLAIVIYNNKSMLGYFDAEFYEIGFHECLMHTSPTILRDLIRHELAHYLTFILHGSHVQPHGSEFRDFCKRTGWGAEVYQSTVCLEGAQPSPAQEESHVLRKVKKLLALSTSNNQNEAEQAMIKSQQLLLKHNLDFTSLNEEEEEKVFLKRILKQKKENAKMRAIGKILETFFVNTVYSRASGFTYLEIIGSAVNLEIAEYVAAFLDRELDKQWLDARKAYIHLKGMIAKNSFFEGIAKGYCLKIDSLKKDYGTETNHSLIVIAKKLNDAKAMVYSRLYTTRSQGHRCRFSSALGEKVGKQLNINPGLHQTAKRSDFYLT